MRLRLQAVDDSANTSSTEYQSALEYLYGRLNYERLASGTARFPFRLHRTAELMRLLGLHHLLAEKFADASNDSCDPPRSRVPCPKIPIIHIAGTKGKGSTASMVASILTACGMKTGLYTSPHLNRIEERFRIDGRECSASELIDLVRTIQPAAQQIIDRGNPPPSFFEITTAMALLHFHRSQCDAIVLETGLGGRLDSTNVCDSTVTAVTTIGLDHQHVLGDTLAEIATEKAGIIKPDADVVCGVMDPEARDVIHDRADRAGATLFQRDVDFSVTSRPDADWGTHLEYRGLTDPLTGEIHAKLSFEGAHQAENAATAISLVLLLARRIESGFSFKKTFSITENNISRGLAAATCMARLERFRMASGLEIILDAAHNNDSISALCRCIRRRAAGRRVVVVFGTSRDKTAAPMLAQLGGVADELVLTRFSGNPRFMPAAELKALMANDFRGPIGVFDDATEACQSVCTERTDANTLVVVCGSFFLAGEIRQWLVSHTDPQQTHAATQPADAHAGSETTTENMFPPEPSSIGEASS